MKQRRHSSTTIAVLVAMLDQPEEESYGYSLTARTGLVSGSLYPILSRLEKRGLVTGEWQQLQEGRPPRRVYKLTDAGREEAERVKAQAEAERPETERVDDGDRVDDVRVDDVH